MKITIDIEATPEEVREVMGLPDVKSFYEDLLSQVREQMESGAEGYDPLTLLKPFMSGQQSMDQFQKLMMQLMSSYTGKSSKAD